MIESPADAERTALQEPAEILSAVAVQRAIGVDRGPAARRLPSRGVRRDPSVAHRSHDAANGVVVLLPPSPVPPRSRSARRRLRLRKVEVSTQQAWRGTCRPRRPAPPPASRSSFPCSLSRAGCVSYGAVSVLVRQRHARRQQPLRPDHFVCVRRPSLTGKRLAISRPYRRGPTAIHVGEAAKLSIDV